MYTDYTDEVDNDDYYSDDGGNKFDKDKIKKIAIIVGAFVIVLILVVVLVKSCAKQNDGGTANADNGNHTPSIIINKENLAIEVGQQKELEVNVLMAATDDPIVGWYSDDSSIASVDAGSSNSKAIITGVQEGTTTIVVSYRENGRVYSNRCSVTVTKALVPLENIDIVQDSITIALGKDVLLEIKTSPDEATADNLIYESDDSDVASVDESGKVRGVNLGTTTVRVKTEDGSISDSITIRVTEDGTTKIDPTSLEIKGLANGLKVGGTAQIDYQLLPENATNKVVTWTSTNPSIATVNSDGVVTGIAAGTCVIVGSTSNNVSGRIEVTVESDVVPVESVTITDGSVINMQVNGTKLLNYTIAPENATNKKVIFTTSDKSIVFVNSWGILAAQKAGTAIITVTTEDGKKTASVTVNVTKNATQTSYPTDDIEDNTGSGGSSGSGNTSSVTGDSNGDVSCMASLMTYITHNGGNKGAVISSVGFSNAKAFNNMTETPTITVTDIASCLDASRVYYYVYYGSSEKNISSTYSEYGNLKKNSKISLKNANGYYLIKVKGYLENSSSVDFNKTYYAIVQNTSTDSVRPIVSNINYSRTSTTKLSVTATINENGSGIKNVKYCLTALTSCTPYSTLKTYTTYPKSTKYTITESINNGSLSSYRYLCINVTDASGNTSVSTCKNIALDTTSPIISRISYSKVSSTNYKFTVAVNETGSGIKNIKYCLASANDCKPNIIFKSFTDYPKSTAYSVSKSITNSGFANTYKYICINATDANDNLSSSVCKQFR